MHIKSNFIKITTEVSSEQFVGWGGIYGQIRNSRGRGRISNYMNTQSSYVNNDAAKIYWTYSTVIIMEVLGPFTL